MFSLFLAVIFLSGCASIIEGSSQDLRVTSDPDGATVVIARANGSEVFRGTTPATASLPTGNGFFSGAEYFVTISADGFEPQTIRVGTNVSGWYLFGNIFVGGLLGWVVVDPATGAMWNLETTHVSGALGAVGTGQQSDIRIVLLDEVPIELRSGMKPISL